MSQIYVIRTMMYCDHTAPPPAYEDLYPGSGDCCEDNSDAKAEAEAQARLIRERLGVLNIPQHYVDQMTRDPPPHSTYFTRTHFGSVSQL